MRNIRTAAVASATALTVLAGGTAIASAEGAPQNKPAEETNSSSKAEDNKDAKADRAVIFAGKQTGENAGTKTYTEKQEDGTVKTVTEKQDDKSLGDVVKDGTKGLFNEAGSSQYVTKEDAKTPFYPTDAFGKKTNPELVPQWARLWIDGTVVAGIGALVGLVIAGVNFASYNGWIQLPQF